MFFVSSVYPYERVMVRVKVKVLPVRRLRLFLNETYRFVSLT